MGGSEEERHWINISFLLESSLIIVPVVAALLGLTSAAETDPMCVGRGESEFFAVPGSCSDVYHCYNGVLSELTCPHGLWFNDKFGYCTYRVDSGCTEEGETSPDPDTTSAPPTTPPPVDLINCTEPQFVMYPNEEDCSKYFVCPGQDQKPVPAVCSDNYYFSKEHAMCVPAELVECVVGVKCPESAGLSYVPHPRDCASYYLCLNGAQSQFSCKDGLLWNSLVNSCDHEEKVICGA